MTYVLITQDMLCAKMKTCSVGRLALSLGVCLTISVVEAMKLPCLVLTCMFYELRHIISLFCVAITMICKWEAYVRLLSALKPCDVI